GTKARTASIAQNGFHGAEIHPGARTVDQRLEDLVHPPAEGEDEIPAVLQLVGRVLIAKPAPPLLVEIERETQTRRIDPALADLAQSPYRPRVGQGVCDPREACGIRDVGETVAFFGELNALLAGLSRDPFVPIDDHLRWEGRVRA